MTPELLQLINQQGFISGLSAYPLAYFGLAMVGLALVLCIHAAIKKTDLPSAVGIPLVIGVCLLGMAFVADCNVIRAECLKAALNDPDFLVTKVQLEGNNITSLTIYGPGQLKTVTVLGTPYTIRVHQSEAIVSNPKILALLLKDQRVARQTHQNP